MSHRYRDDEVARLIARCGGALGDDTLARFRRGVLEIRRGWRVRRIAWWFAAAVVIAGALGLAGTLHVVLSYDRFLSALELAAWVAPGVLVAALGVALGRPRGTRIDGARRSIRIDGADHPLADATLALTRHLDDRGTFDLELVVRGGPSIVALHGVHAPTAARMKALAIAIASWLGTPLVETTSLAALESLRAADAQLGLAEPRPPGDRAPGPGHDSVPGTLEEAVVDVATFAVNLLDGL